MPTHPSTQLIIAFSSLSFKGRQGFCSCGKGGAVGIIISYMNITHFLLKIIPYALSIAGGVFVFDFSQKYLQDPSWIDLTNNIAASLLAIPLVFLFYDYSNFLITRRMKRTQHANTVNTIDGFLFKILAQMKNIIQIPRIEVPMQDLNLNYKRLDLDIKYIRALKRHLEDMEDLLYKSDKIEILDPQHTQILSFIVQELNQILNEYKFHNSPREIARYIETTLSMIDDWFYVTGYTTRTQKHRKKW